MKAYVSELENGNVLVQVRAEGEDKGMAGDLIEDIPVDGEFWGIPYGDLLSAANDSGIIELPKELSNLI